MRSVMSVIVSLGFILLAHSPSPAQLFSNSLRGTVRVTANAGPFAMIRVQLERLGMPLQATFLRESRFEFFNLERGQYTLIVDAPGFQTVRQEVDVPGDWPV